MRYEVLRKAAADPTDWFGRIVYESAADTVALVNAGTQCPLGVVTRVEAENSADYRVVVCTFGVAMVAVGDTGLTAGTATFITGEDDPDAAANDGKAIAAAAGEYYVGKVLLHSNATEDQKLPCVVCPGQLAQAGT